MILQYLIIDLFRTKQYETDEDEKAREEEQRQKREKEKAWQDSMRVNLKKEKERDRKGGGSYRQVSSSYLKAAAYAAESHLEMSDEEHEEKEEEGEPMRRELTEDEVDSSGNKTDNNTPDGGLKSTMTRRSGELKPGQVLPLTLPTLSPKREIVVSQHSVDFPL